MAAAGHTVASRPGLQEEIMKARENLRPKNNVVLKSVQLKTPITSHQEPFPNPARYNYRSFIASHGKYTVHRIVHDGYYWRWNFIPSLGGQPSTGAFPSRMGTRKVELTVPENTTHIVICTSNDVKNTNNNISVDLATTLGPSSTLQGPNPNGDPGDEEEIDPPSMTNQVSPTILVKPAKIMSKANGLHKKNDYTCLECGKTYSTSSNLARHRQNHR